MRCDRPRPIRILNPLFLSGVNLLDMANLIGLFGIFSIGEGLAIITGGIDLSVGSMFSLLGVVFIDSVAYRDVGWPRSIRNQHVPASHRRLRTLLRSLTVIIILKAARRTRCTGQVLPAGASADRTGRRLTIYAHRPADHRCRSVSSRSGSR
jgi:ribose/xylose/arabinose/galactoside ABC-type transport system permease subunit